MKSIRSWWATQTKGLDKAPAWAYWVMVCCILVALPFTVGVWHLAGPWAVLFALIVAYLLMLFIVAGYEADKRADERRGRGGGGGGINA